jgi:Arc/MetJ-type ribon-helix-helix transcriptional regulator
MRRSYPDADIGEGELTAWFVGRLPDDWFSGPPDVTLDREEIVVVGAVPEPEYPSGSDDAAKAAARRARIQRFREETRDARMRIADEAERRTGRKVAWGARCGDDRYVFTNLAVPVMTRLRMPERQVLDTLVGAGVARSRSDALAWCVRLVREHQGEWIQQLRDALVAVDEARAVGPSPSGG